MTQLPRKFEFEFPNEEEQTPKEQITDMIEGIKKFIKKENLDAILEILKDIELPIFTKDEIDILETLLEKNLKKDIIDMIKEVGIEDDINIKQKKKELIDSVFEYFTEEADDEEISNAFYSLLEAKSIKEVNTKLILELIERHLLDIEKEDLLDILETLDDELETAERAGEELEELFEEFDIEEGTKEEKMEKQRIKEGVKKQTPGAMKQMGLKNRSKLKFRK